MSITILDHLAPVRRRQRRLLVLRATAWGLLAGAAGSLVLLLAFWWTEQPLLLGTALAVLGAAPLAGAWSGARRRRTWGDAAAAVDAHYRLKDRVISALEFAAEPSPTEFQATQVRDTL